MSTYAKDRMELPRASRSTLIVDNPFVFFPCLFDMPLKLAAQAVGVGSDRVKRAFCALMDDARLRWPCQEIYQETHQFITKRMIVAARDGEIFRLRKWISQNRGGDVMNAEELLRVLERAERFARNYGVVKTGLPPKKEHGALAAEGVIARWREQRDYAALLAEEGTAEPLPSVELPFYEQFDLDRLFEETGDELGLGGR